MEIQNNSDSKTNELLVENDHLYHYAYHRVSTYDPNMCSAARFSPPYENAQTETNTSGVYENPVLIANHGTIDSIITAAESIQSYHVASGGRQYEEYHRPGHLTEQNPAIYIQNEINHVQTIDSTCSGEQQIPGASNTTTYSHQITNEQATENVVASETIQIVLRQTSNGNFYQNFYVNDEVRESGHLMGLVQIENHTDGIYQQQCAIDKSTFDMATILCGKLPDGGDLIETEDNFNNLSAEIINNAAPHTEEFLAGTYNSIEQQHQHHSAISLHDRDQQRILLESTMSPLLAAVNDITQRDAERQCYLHQNPDKETNLDIFTNIVTQRILDTNEQSRIFDHDKNEFVDISEMQNINRAISKDLNQKPYGLIDDDECFLVSDKPVETRARASLPTSYLYFGKSGVFVEEPSVFAKKEIPLKTKFGPFEGEIRQTRDDVIDVLRFQTSRIYPLLLLDRTKILEVANENMSNWMRFVRMATTFTEQNLLLFEDSGKLYFKCCQAIIPKQELHVGYSKEYAEKHGLKVLIPSENEKCDIYNKENPWVCFECDQRFPTSKEMQNHLNVHDPDEPNNRGTKSSKRGRRTKRRKPKCLKLRKNTSNGCLICLKVFMTRVSLKKHMAVHAAGKRSEKITNNSKPTSRCNICYKKFKSEDKLKAHRIMHVKNEEKPFSCNICTHRCSTATALTAHIKSHTSRYFNCVYCSATFKHVAIFKEHVEVHASNGMFPCTICQKQFREYYLIRKHLKVFHPAVKYSCNECGKQFLSMNFLRRHKVCHSEKRDFLCSHCGKQFKRKDKLREHIIRMHSENRKARARRKPMQRQIPNDVYSTAEMKPHADDDHRRNMNESFAENIQGDYQQFTFKCIHCMVGFKRRGMLVNHMAKRHPNVAIESVPELNMPISRPQSLFRCQYCSKVYRSNAKRKLHILKNHPGQDLPPPLRSNAAISETFLETIGNLTTEPHRCKWCYKQYVSRSRLLQHCRKAHPHIQNDFDFEADVRIYQDDNYKNYYANSTVDFYRPPDSPENKLLKLSSAALELSSIEDPKFFDLLNERSHTLDHNSNHPSQPDTSEIDDQTDCSGNDHTDTNIVRNENGFSKVDVNFKVIESEFNETSSNGELNRFPQLFEESIACI